MINNLFEPDIIAPVQFQAHFASHSLSPPQKLMFAVLIEAIDCFKQYAAARDGRSERLFREAQEWIMECGSEWPFSFENICDTLHLNAGYIRRRLIEDDSPSTPIKIPRWFTNRPLRIND